MGHLSQPDLTARIEVRRGREGSQRSVTAKVVELLSIPVAA